MRRFIFVAIALFLAAAPVVSRAQVYDEATIEAHLQEIYELNGERMLKWDRPIRYIVAGFDSAATKQLVVDQFTYLGELTELDIRSAEETGEKGNFLLVFSDDYAALAELPTLRAVFGREDQSDAEYRAMLEELDREQVSRAVTNRTEEALTFHARLVNPSAWKDDVFISRVLRLIVQGLTQAGTSQRIEPSVFNVPATLGPMSRLPSFDEAYLRALYSPAILSGIPKDVAIRKMTAAIAADLNN